MSQNNMYQRGRTASVGTRFKVEYNHNLKWHENRQKLLINFGR